MKINILKNSLFVMLALPLSDKSKWQIEKYSSIPVNEVSFSDEGMFVKVLNSASPIIHKLESKTMINGFKVAGKFFGLPKLKDVSKQGDNGYDDYVLRIGFIVPGEKTLSGINKMFAASWIKHLYALSPEGMGMDRIQFFNFTQNKDQVGKSRIHPVSNLIHEAFIEFVNESGNFKFDYKLKQPVEAVAIWISVDGDDTSSEYSILLSSLVIN